MSIPLPIIIIAVVAVIAAVALILLSNNQTTGSVSIDDFNKIPQQRTSDGGFVIGYPDAPLTIIEFADYACPHCQEYKPTIDRFFNDYVKTGKAKFELRIFPTAGGQTTEFFGKIAVCMEQQKTGAYWMASELFITKAMQGDYGQNTGREVASEIGVDYNQALACTQNQDQVATDVQLGSSIGITGTPAIAVRFGDAPPTFLTFAGHTYNQGGIPYDVLSQVVTAMS
jgi:protein-disulfide isomerase